jgi:hypothetical protein
MAAHSASTSRDQSPPYLLDAPGLDAALGGSVDDSREF